MTHNDQPSATYVTRIQDVYESRQPSGRKQMISDDQTRIINLDDGVQAWIDTVTGLMWEVKNEQNITFMYTWRKGSLDKVAESAIAYLEDEIKDCQSYIDRMNETKYAGYDDWRMPSIRELETLLYNDGETKSVKAPLCHNVMSGVWSNTPTAILQRFKYSDNWLKTAAIYGIKIMDFRSMSVASYDHEFALWVRGVREVAGTARTAEQRFRAAFGCL